jgi:transposase-like protein
MSLLKRRSFPVAIIPLWYTGAAYRFLRKALKAMSDYPPSFITTDRLASYLKTILRLQIEGLLPNDVGRRMSKSLNNILEADYGAPKRMI